MTVDILSYLDPPEILFVRELKQQGCAIRRLLRLNQDNEPWSLRGWYRQRWQCAFRELSGVRTANDLGIEIVDLERRLFPNCLEKELWDTPPDTLLTFNAPILPSSLIDSASCRLINIHLGNPSAYRGMNTVFWPLYFRDYNNICVSIHDIDDGIDTGNLLAQGWPQMSRKDSELTLVDKLSVLGAQLFSSLQSRAGGIGKGVEFHPGRLYLDGERTILKELALRLRMVSGERLIEQEQRQKLF